MGGGIQEELGSRYHAFQHVGERWRMTETTEIRCGHESKDDKDGMSWYIPGM